MTIYALWPDGTCMTAETWDDLEDQVRDAQWVEMSVPELRETMARRAKLWAGESIVIPTHTAEAMFRGLAAVDMVRFDFD